MIHALDWLLGYHRVCVPQEHVTEAAEALLSRGVGCRLLPTGHMTVPHRRLRAVREALSALPYTVSDMQGALGFLYRHRRRYGVLAALVCLLVCAVLSSRVVWDVRVEGDTPLDAEAVREELAACGLFSGALWRRVDFGKTETALLSSSPDIAWVSIYRRGHVAYVTVAEKTVHETPPPPVGYASLVADCDAVIDEVLVHKGYAVVKKGDTVRAGDLLISGILPSEVGGGLCFAEGEIRGRVETSVSVTVSRQLQTVRTAERTFLGARVNFFGFSLNILKTYGNVPENCAIIEEKRQVSLLGDHRLPISVTSVYRAEEQPRVRVLTEEEMTALAAERLQQAVRERLGDGELLSIRTEGSFTEEGYTMTAYLVFRTSIGRIVPLSVVE